MQLPYEVMRAVEAKAAEYKLPLAHVAAITEVESDGKIFGPDGRPMVLFEPHKFFLKLAGPARDEAVKLKLASKTWNKKLYPKSQAGRWRQIEDAAALCDRHGLWNGLAYESASYGVGQVLGEHWDDLEFESFQAFLSVMMSGAEGQIDIMLRFVVKNGLDDELRDGQWAAFARGYNGPKYAANKYHTKMAAAALRYQGGTTAKPDGMLRMGAKGARVRELQALLVRAGHQVKVDGDFGPSTKKALRAFQKAHGITVDGVAGPETQKALAAFRQGEGDAPGEQKITEMPDVQQGAGGLGGGLAIEVLQTKVDDATAQLQTVAGFEPWVGYGLTALSLLALGLAAWGAYKVVSGLLSRNRTVEA